MESGLLSVSIIGLIAFAVSMLTLFSGFGLGTLLMPAFAVLFPVEVAVAATAVVHALNNLFKVGLLYRSAVLHVLVYFGLPAVGTAFVGALLLSELSQQPPVFIWQLGEREAVITPLKAVMGSLIVVFGVIELLPPLRSLRLSPRWLSLGGALSGFFGGLSGHQGALRAAFLSTLNLSPPSFTATQAVLACMVDAARLVVYGGAFFAGRMAGVSSREQWTLVGFATCCAFGGTLLGKQLLPSVTMAGVRVITGILLLVVGAGLGSGLI